MSFIFFIFIFSATKYVALTYRRVSAVVDVGLRLSPVICCACLSIGVEFADTSAAVRQGNQLNRKPAGDALFRFESNRIGSTNRLFDPVSLASDPSLTSMGVLSHRGMDTRWG